MLNGKRPWQKALAENFLLILTLIGIVLTRVVGKILYPKFGINNLLSLVIASIGFIFIVYSKREQLKNRDYFSFGVHSQKARDMNFYRLGYFFFLLGLLLTFLM